MSHSHKITIIADQFIKIFGEDVNLYKIISIHLDENGEIERYSTHEDDHQRLIKSNWHVIRSSGGKNERSGMHINAV